MIPATDADVPAVWQELGVPGIADVHVHFMPHNVMAKVQAYFDNAGPLLGRAWPITYRGDDDDRLARLDGMGVRAFPALAYAHRPGMSAWLNDWTLGFAPAVPTATFFAEPEALSYVTDALDRGARLFKVHAQVGGWDPRSPLLDDVWGLLEQRGTPIVAHVGNGPTPGAYTGIGPISEVLQRFPGLQLVVAHMGMPDYADFAALAERYENVRLDTTMAFTPFTGQTTPAAAGLSDAQLRDLGLAGKVLWGSDFPNIPHTYAEALASVVRLDLGDDWLRAVLWDAPARVLGVS